MPLGNVYEYQSSLLPRGWQSLNVKLWSHYGSSQLTIAIWWCPCEPTACRDDVGWSTPPPVAQALIGHTNSISADCSFTVTCAPLSEILTRFILLQFTEKEEGDALHVMWRLLFSCKVMEFEKKIEPNLGNREILDYHNLGSVQKKWKRNVTELAGLDWLGC